MGLNDDDQLSCSRITHPPIPPINKAQSDLSNSAHVVLWRANRAEMNLGTPIKVQSMAVGLEKALPVKAIWLHKQHQKLYPGLRLKSKEKCHSK
jgi:hypothetical protein